MGGKASLILVLGFATILAYLAGNLSRLKKQSNGTMALYAASAQSHQLALSGANVGVSKLFQDSTWRGSVTQTVANGVLSGSFTYSTVAQPGGGLALRSVSTAKAPNGKTIRDTVIVYYGAFTQQTFSLYAWMTDKEDGVNWVTGDTVWGRLHSNDNLTVNGSPVFMQKVTTTKGFSPAPGKGTNKAIFKKGYETGVASIEFPKDISELVNASTSGGRKYTADITVALNPGTSASGDGSVVVTCGSAKDTIALSDPSFNGVILGTGKVSISGVLDGRLTVASMKYIYITDNVRYENESVSSSDDMLGLVSDDDVIVANNTANQSDCIINASIFARTGSFTAEDYGKGSPRGVLRLLGSIVHSKRGPVGTLSGGTLKTGYYKRYTFDDRLADNSVRPPFYPGFYPKTMRIVGWWENTRALQWWD